MKKLAIIWAVLLTIYVAGLGFYIWQQEAGFRASITELVGYTGKVGYEDIEWGTPGVGVGSEETFSTPTYTGASQSLTKIYDSQIPVISQVNEYVGNLFRSVYSAIIYPEDIIAAGPWVDARRYSATDLSAVESALGGTGTDYVVIIPIQYTINSNLTFSDNLHIFCYPNALLIANGVTVTVNATWKGFAGIYSIVTGNGSLVFGDGTVEKVYPEWWGAIADGTTDSTDEIQTALNTGFDVQLSSGDYLLSAIDILTTGQKLLGASNTTISVNNASDIGITIGSDASYVDNVLIHGITFSKDGGTPTAFIQNRKGLKNTISHCIFDDQTITYCIDNYIGYRLAIDHCSFDTVTVTSAIYFRYANDSSTWSSSNSITNCVFSALPSGYAITIEGGGNHSIRDSVIQSCDGNGGIFLNTSGHKRLPHLTVDGVLFEENDGGPDIEIVDDATNFVYNMGVIGCKFTNTDVVLEAEVDLGSYSSATFVACSSTESAKLVISGNGAQAHATVIGCNGSLTGGDFYTHSGTVRITEIGSAATDQIKILNSSGSEVFALDQNGVINLNSIENAFVHETRQVFDDLDTTPSVSGGNVFTFSNSGSTVITDFDDGANGQVIFLNFNDANTDVDFTGTNLEGNGGVDWTSIAQNDSMICHYNGTKWFCDVSDNTP